MRSSQRQLLVMIPIACLTAVALATGGCTNDSMIRVSGRVADDVLVVQAPSLPSVPPNPDAGLTASASQGGSGSTLGRSAPATITAMTGLGSVSRIATVAVSPGDAVRAGDVVVEFDAAALEANVAVARADERVARAQVGVVSAAIEEADSAESTLAANRRTIRDTIAQLTTTRAQLAGRLVQLKSMLRAGVGASLSASSTTSTPPGAGQSGPTPGQVRAMIVQLEASIAKVDAGIAKAHQGLSQAATAESTLDDARTRLEDLLSVARVAADASSVGVRAAEYQRSLAVVRAPVAGVILQIADVGDVLAPGATVARVRKPVATQVLTWLPPADLRRIAAGDRAQITGDWFASDVSIPGRITKIGERADYPPTSFATKDVHLTRAVPVEITVDHNAAGGRSSSGSLPPGTPVDVTILPRSATRH